jgi:hypothetical protein
MRRYLRQGEAAETQVRPKAHTLDVAQQALAQQQLDGPAQGNGAVVQRLLTEQQVTVKVPLRTLQRVLAPRRWEKRAAELGYLPLEKQNRPPLLSARQPALRAREHVHHDDPNHHAMGARLRRREDRRGRAGPNPRSTATSWSSRATATRLLGSSK